MQKLVPSLLVALLGAMLPAGASADTLSLAGEWRFEIATPDIKAPPFPSDPSGTIHLPGTMDDAGLGPVNPQPPSLNGPWRLHDYEGPAWYQREIDIPNAWAGKRVTLLLERCRWVTTVWLDGKPCGAQDSLIAPHVYDFGTEVVPGKHRLTICVDNSVKINLGVFVSALFGGTWGNMNGIVGRIELASTPPVWIDDVQVYPDVDRMLAHVVVKIGNATGQPGHGALTIGSKTIDATWDAKGGHAEMDADMHGAKLWDEFSPNLTGVTVKLGSDSRTVRFGMRKFAVRGTQFTMNGRTLYLRGTLDCSIFPLTGYPPTDVPSWQRVYRIMKSYGLNFIRFHSWCPPDAAFAAADIEGIMIQAEGPMANVDAGKDPARDAFLGAELQRMVDTYGNHPSFCLMTLGNEYGGNDAILSGWVNRLITCDPRHIYSSPSKGQATANRQWTELSKGRGVPSPDTMRDLASTVASDSRPIIGHEIGQWMYFPDFREIKKWSGVMALKNFEIIRDDMRKKDLLDLAPRYVQASGQLATLLYKEEIEVLLRTPGYAGFSLLDLHDYPTQGTAVIGPLDAFWDSKGFITPAAFRQYCGPTVPLLRMPKRTYTTDEPFQATADVANYGPADLKSVEPAWSITNEQGDQIASGKWPAMTLQTGTLTVVGPLTASLATAHAPCKLTVTVSLQTGGIRNTWNIWVYPANVQPVPPTNVVTCDEWNDAAKSALANGKTVFLMTTNLANSLPGSLKPVFWSPVWFPNKNPLTMGLLLDPANPAFAKFPTEFYSDWQWWDILKQSSTLILDKAPAGFRPILRVMDNFARNGNLGDLFEARVGKGRLLFCSMDLRDPKNRRPAARQLLASLYAYVGSNQFQPTQSLSPDTLDALLAKSATLPQASPKPSP
jgi:hypothetical protein